MSILVRANQEGLRGVRFAGARFGVDIFSMLRSYILPTHNTFTKVVVVDVVASATRLFRYSASMMKSRSASESTDAGLSFHSLI